MPLSMLAAGEAGTVRAVTGKDEERAHLARLGFVAGAWVWVVSSLGGSLILRVKDSRVALDRAMAARVLMG